MVDLAWPLSPDIHGADSLVSHYAKSSLVLGKVLGLSFASDNSQTSPIAEQVTGSKLCPAGCYLPYSSLQILWDLKMGSL